MWVHHTAATIRQGSKTDTNAKVLKAKLLLNWTSPYKVLAIGPCSSTDIPDGSPLSAKFLYLDLRSDVPGAEAHQRASVQCCKLCANPHDRGDMPKYSPAGLTQYVLNNISKEPPPCHVTQNGVSTHLQRLEVEKITGHQSDPDQGGVIAVVYETHWTRLPFWEREMDRQLSRRERFALLGRHLEPAPPN